MNSDRIHRLGLPTDAELRAYRIWDSYFTPAHSRPGANGFDGIVADVERALPAIKKAHIEKLCYFPHVGVGTTSDRAYEQLVQRKPSVVLEPIRRWPDRLMGMIQLNAANLQGSLEAIRRWLRDGPMKGVYFPGGGPGATCCTDKNFHPLIEEIQKCGGVIMQHTWYKTGGKQGAGESTPAELATLAASHPEQVFLCAHAGGEWQQGIRAIQSQRNVWAETSGFDATSGFMEMAVRELGADRIVFGSHLPSRSLGTELGKVIGARISASDRRLILGENYRRLLPSAQ